MATKPKTAKPEKRQITSIYMSAGTLRLLRNVAASRAEKHGGRPSVSDVVRELIEGHRKELEREAKQ